MIVGGYTLDLYCRDSAASKVTEGPDPHAYRTGFEQFYGRTYSECKRQAVKAGWRFDKDDDVTCPWCLKKKK